MKILDTWYKRFIAGLCLGIVLVLSLSGLAQSQAADPTPPSQPVKLIFIHHSTGEAWLADEHGGLGQALAENNYFVSDTNYGWGPESIGDRTDILDWLEWFRSSQTEVYLAALFNESEQHASYARILDDPGGENSIVLFKSCFPNSNLEGSPTDPPDPEGWLSVGHAKYVYNEILRTFAARPDKLFVIITAPPLSDGTYAANARAFNDWLLNDWLAENNYSLNNVAVFDFYNILTSPDAHHRYSNGQIEHLAQSSNTLYYPTEDDHPSAAGDRKATEEFIPLLNIFYHRWQAGAPLQPIAAASPTVEAAVGAEIEPAQPAPALLAASQIDGFEGPNSLSSGWQAYWDEAASTRITCAASAANAHNGTSSLQIDYEVAPESWATCELSFDRSQDWTRFAGLSFALHAGQPDLVFNIDLFYGPAESRALYVAALKSSTESVSGWQTVRLDWQDFQRVSWEENGGSPLPDAHEISGLAFGFNISAETPNSGVLWIDDLELLAADENSAEPSIVPAPVEAPAAEQPVLTPLPEPDRDNGPCAAGILPLVLLSAIWLVRSGKGAGDGP